MMSITSNILKTYNSGKRKLNTDDIWLWMERRLIHLRNLVSDMFSMLGVSCKNMKLCPFLKDDCGGGVVCWSAAEEG